MHPKHQQRSLWQSIKKPSPKNLAPAHLHHHLARLLNWVSHLLLLLKNWALSQWIQYVKQIVHCLISSVLPQVLVTKSSVIVSWPWHPINPSPLCPITSMCLLPILLYAPMFPDYLYSLCITTNWWALCLFCLSIQLPDMFPFMIPVTYCSRPVILTNMICLGESVMNITKLTHRTAQTVLIVSLPNPPSITPNILL